MQVNQYGPRPHRPSEPGARAGTGDRRKPGGRHGDYRRVAADRRSRSRCRAVSGRGEPRRGDARTRRHGHRISLLRRSGGRTRPVARSPRVLRQRHRPRTGGGRHRPPRSGVRTLDGLRTQPARVPPFADRGRLDVLRPGQTLRIASQPNSRRPTGRLARTGSTTAPSSLGPPTSRRSADLGPPTATAVATATIRRAGSIRSSPAPFRAAHRPTRVRPSARVTDLDAPTRCGIAGSAAPGSVTPPRSGASARCHRPPARRRTTWCSTPQQSDACRHDPCRSDPAPPALGPVRVATPRRAPSGSPPRAGRARSPSR